MDFWDVISKRESIRNYDSSRPVSREILLKILEAGRMAPSASNRQPWRFVVVSSPLMLQKMHSCYTQQWFYDAPHILVVIGNKNDAWVRAYDCYNSIETDLTIAMDHMILAAENEGVGTCWIAAFNPDLLREALALKEHERVYAITPLGYSQKRVVKRGLKPRKALEDCVEFI